MQSGFKATFAILFILMGALQGVVAHSPPEKDLIAAGDLRDRLATMRQLGLFRYDRGLQERAAFKVHQMVLDTTNLSLAEKQYALFRGPFKSFPYAAYPSLPSTGLVRTLTLLIDFADYRATTLFPGLDNAAVAKSIYAEAKDAAQAEMPYDSVRAYYSRASEEKLDIEGEVIGWIHLPKKRAEYEPKYPKNADEVKRAEIKNRALFKLITTALDMAPAIDYSRFDNNARESIDVINVIYAGPASDRDEANWGKFWWAYQWEFYIKDADTKKYGGKRLTRFIFQFVERRGDGSFNPRTLIHETGHALGLPDLYDYCPKIWFAQKKCEGVAEPGPDGGVGGLDIMDANKGNHNALSRIFLDWVVPKFLTRGQHAGVRLAPSGGKPEGVKAVALFPNLPETNAPAQEFFILENRRRLGNDSGKAGMPSDGLIIWHVDSSVNSAKDDFAFDNSYTPRKLMRLVRATSSQDFSDFAHKERASRRDYYLNGTEFGPKSVPSSKGYDGAPTGVWIKNIRDDGDDVLVDIEFEQRIASVPAPPRFPRAVFSGLDRVEVTTDVGARGPATEPVDQVKLEKLQDRLTRASAKELAEMWKSASDGVNPNGEVSESNLVAEAILTTWASKDGRAAIDALLALPRSRFVAFVYPRAMLAWAVRSPSLASDWYFASEQAKLRASPLSIGEDAARALLRWKAQVDPKAALAAVELLTKTTELSGAVRGLDEAALRVGLPVTFFKGELKKLPTNGQRALAIKELNLSIQKMIAVELQHKSTPF